MVAPGFHPVKECNQSSHFSVFHLLNLYLLKINPILASVWWHWSSNPAYVNGNWFSPCGNDLMACFKGRIIVNNLHSVILSLRIYPKEIIQNMGNVLCKKLFIILGSYKQSKSPSIWAWLDKWYYTPSVEYFIVRNYYNKYRLALWKKIWAIMVESKAAQK